MKLQDFRYYKSATLIQPQRVKIIIPDFSFSLPTWSGASDLLGEMELSNDYYFSLKLPIRSFGAGFILAIRWRDEGIDYRLKLWEDVGEVLFYPLYNGEIIGLNAVVEIWNINTNDAPVNASAFTLYSSLLAFPNGSCCACCSNPDVSQTLAVVAADPCAAYSYCNPFCQT
jgi:hypothetical protein